MKAVIRTLKTFLADESAPTAVEYALMLGGILLLVAGAVYVLGGRVAGIFNQASDALR